MKEFILCKYGEVVLKGLNKASFENPKWRYGPWAYADIERQLTP